MSFHLWSHVQAYIDIFRTEICDDVREECTKFGKVLELKAPRPSGGSRQSAGVGKVYVKFDSTESAHQALTALAGRKFADRTVVTTYFPEVSWINVCQFCHEQANNE